MYGSGRHGKRRLGTLLQVILEGTWKIDWKGPEGIPPASYLDIDRSKGLFSCTVGISVWYGRALASSQISSAGHLEI